MTKNPFHHFTPLSSDSNPDRQFISIRGLSHRLIPGIRDALQFYSENCGKAYNCVSPSPFFYPYSFPLPPNENLNSVISSHIPSMASVMCGKPLVKTVKGDLEGLEDVRSELEGMFGMKEDEWDELSETMKECFEYVKG
jgi:hypothetical protein